MAPENDSPNERAPCNECGRYTNHQVLYSQPHDWVEEDGQGQPFLVANGGKDVLKCRGCDGFTLREWLEGDVVGGRSETYYPPRVSRKPPKWLHLHQDSELRGLLNEIYGALHADHRRLALMGCRAALDRILTESVGDIGGFESKLKRMAEERLLSSTHLSILQTAIDAGSASAHRSYLPSTEALDQVVSIVEHLAQTGVLASEAEAIRRQTPPRPPRQGT